MGSSGAGGSRETGGAAGSSGGAVGAAGGALAAGGSAGKASMGGAPFGGSAGAASGVAGAAGIAGSSAGGSSAGGSSAGASSNGASSNGGAFNGGASNGGSAGAAAGSGGGGTAGTAFNCNLVFGVSPTGQWFDSGFLNLVDGTRWESIWVAHHYTNFWADPQDSAWAMAFDPYPGPAHACAQSSTAPDRILFVAVNWQYTTAAQWEADLTKIVQNLQSKYPSVRRIELMTLTRAPGNKLCSASGSTETIIPAWTDIAIAAMVTQYPGLVVQAPQFEVPACSDFLNNGAMPQYTTAGAVDVARAMGAYYAAHP
jgi:hypothetical protein